MALHQDVAVLGAAGQTGRRLVRALARRGARVRAVVHRMEQAETTPEAAAVQALELQDMAALTTALQDVAVAYYIPPTFDADEEEFGANMINAALMAKLPRLVYHSVLHSATPAMPHHHRKSMVELALRESPLTWTIVQPAMYMQTPLAFANAERTRLTVGFDPHRLFTPIDLEDLAEAVAAVLLDSGHEFATYELAGAERIDLTSMAATLTRVLGHEVAIQRMPSAVVASVAALRMGPSAARVLKAMLDHYDAHGLIGNANVLRMLLRREPTAFAAAMTRDLRTA